MVVNGGIIRARICAAFAAVLVVVLSAPAVFAGATPLAHVETVGSGEAQLILIPGWMCDWTVWDEFMRRNSEHYTMHAVTLPGFVGAAPPVDTPHEDELEAFDETPWINNAVKSIAALIVEEGIENPIIIGHSLGGQIAMRMAIERPELVGMVVTVDGMPAVPLKYKTDLEGGADRAALIENAYEPWLRAMSADAWKEKFDQAVANLVETASHREQLHRMFDNTEREPSVRYLVEALKTDITPEIEQIKAPLLAIAAIEDCPEAPAEFEESICATWQEQLSMVPDAQIVFFEHAKHFFFLTQTEAFDTAIARFVEGKPVEMRLVMQEDAKAHPVKRRKVIKGVRERPER